METSFSTINSLMSLFLYKVSKRPRDINVEEKGILGKLIPAKGTYPASYGQRKPMLL